MIKNCGEEESGHSRVFTDCIKGKWDRCRSESEDQSRTGFCFCSFSVDKRDLSCQREAAGNIR